jgi:PadR family transcriptional regulator PadR
LYSELYSGLIRLHVLHHAAQEPIFGLGMIEELARHGYRISPGTLYPLLHRMERIGYLTVSEVRNGKSLRRVYCATARGRRALTAAKAKIRSSLLKWSKESDRPHSPAQPMMAKSSAPLPYPRFLQKPARPHKALYRLDLLYPPDKTKNYRYGCLV